ncbi:anti-sigma-B factor antagonist [Actinocatenispora thailandica]|uniref:Anti-sigma factor antagonist n=1 Tax=Actinocatenispora thailandica TaxID=227318 RepID=A0A7R7HVB9_9ACTN|nr:STAS domain-containing protein [Actinocatenispora thailandica]BCJ32719.1 anti-sigma-B factor antagonist [Actinocatenispora thailandica]
MELSLQTGTVADRTILRVTGEIDVYTAPRLRQRLVQLVEDGARHLVVDLGGVEFLDSTGLGVLVGGLKRMRALSGSFALVCDQERILKIFRITGLDRIFTIVPTEQDALAVAPDPGGAEDRTDGGHAVPPATDR